MELYFHFKYLFFCNSVHKTETAASELLIVLPWEQVLAQIITTHLNSIHIPL